MKRFLSFIKEIAEKEFDPRKYFLLLCGIFAGICLLASLFVFILDPYVYFHKPLLTPYFVKSYAMIPGLLKNREYDTVLFGSSISKNFYLSDLDTLYNGKSIKATSSSLPAEALGQYITLALKNPSFRHGIIAIDLTAFTKPPEDNPRLRYDYLYKGSLLPVKYLLSTDSLSSSFKLLRENLKKSFSKKEVKYMDWNYMFGEYKKCSNSRMKAGIRENKKYKRAPLPVTPEAAEKMEKYLFSHIKNNPNCTFDLFLPPYHIYFWCVLKNTGTLEGYLSLRNHFIARAQDFPNVKLHDFQAEPAVVCNMEIYRDEMHYHKETNAWMAREMKKGTYLVNKAAGEKNTAKIRELLQKHLAGYLAI